jgi:phage/plasmid-associated DNA primase
VLDDEIKAIAVSVLAEQVDKVMRPRVSSMIDIFRTHNWMSDLHFELGDPNLVVMADGYRAYENGRWVKVPTDKDLHRRITFPGKYTNARPDRFDQFLNEILCDVDGQPLPDRDQLRDLVWEMLGYCLVTHTRYEQCFIFEGPGGNGKTKIGTLAKDMVGRGNTASVQPAQMGNVFQRSHLECKLLNLVTELNQNAELEDGMLKAIVSGEMMSVEHKF